MSQTLTWSFKVQVTGGPTISIADAISVEAYDKIEATVPGSGTATVNIQPGDGAEFLLITASDYASLTYVVDAGPDTVTLDGPHILIGEGAVSLLGSTQNQIVFTNADPADVDVSILVGRKATT